MADYQFVAFFMVTGQPVAAAGSASDALRLATQTHLDPSEDFVEVLDCGENGAKIMRPMHGITLSDARKLHRTVFRGAGYPHIPAIALT